MSDNAALHRVGSRLAEVPWPILDKALENRLILSCVIWLVDKVLENRLILSCATWLVVRFTRRPLRLFLPIHFREHMFSLDLPLRQFVIGSSRDVVQRVLVKGAGRYPKSQVIQPPLVPLIGQGLFAAEHREVPSIRRMFIRAIAQVDDRTIAATSERLLEAYRRRWHRDGSVARLPVSSEMSRLTLDIVSECLFRTRFTEAESEEFSRLFFTYQFFASPLRLFPWVGKRPFAPLYRARQMRIAARMRELMRIRFVDALQDPSSSFATSPFALSAAERERGGEAPLSDERLLDEVAVMLLAGHETSASVLSWLLRELAGDVALQDRLRQDIAQATGAAATAAIAAGTDIPLLKSLINEVLRLYPPIPIYARDAVSPDNIEDTPIRPGAMVLVPPWVIHRHAALWDDPLSFRPDRFRASAPTDIASRFMPFGSGARACPGGRFAMVEMQVLVAGIAQAFRLDPLDGRTARPLGNLSTRPDREIHIALTPLAPAIKAPVP